MLPLFTVPPSNGQGGQKKAIPGQFIARATTSYAPQPQRMQSQSMSRPGTEVLRHVGRAV